MMPKGLVRPREFPSQRPKLQRKAALNQEGLREPHEAPRNADDHVAVVFEDRASPRPDRSHRAEAVTHCQHHNYGN